MQKYHQDRIDRIKKQLYSFYHEKNYDQARGIAYTFLEFMAPSLDIIVEPEILFGFSNIYFYFIVKSNIKCMVKCSDLTDFYVRTIDDDELSIISVKDYQEIIEYLEKNCLMVIS